MKNKKNILRNILLAAGLLLLLAAVCTTVFSKIASDKSAIDCDSVAAFMENILPKRTAGIKDGKTGADMPAVTYEGNEYAALLTVPALSVKLPVCAVWEDRLVQNVPCRFTGNPYDGSLIIGGMDADGGFDFLSDLDVGYIIIVTDMKGNEFHYSVSVVKHSDNANAETLMEDAFDLTLFAKDKRSGYWLLVKCNTVKV